MTDTAPTASPPEAPAGSALVTQEQRRLEIEARRDEKTVVEKTLMEELIREIGTLDGGKLQRWVVRVPLYAKHQYLIPGARRNKKERGSSGRDEWVGEYSAGIRAEGYDHLNKVAGIRFFTPPTVHNRAGDEVPNPIHARDYLYHREIGQGYSETGQMVLYVEDIEIDFQMAWEAERLKKLAMLTKPKRGRQSGGGGEPEMGGWDDDGDGGPAAGPSAAPAAAVAPVAPAQPEELIIRDENGMPKQGARGELLFRLPQADEVAAMQRIVTLRNFGGRMAKTIARRRILETALGLRTLWTKELAARPELETQWVWVTGWRDMLTAEEAWEKAKSDQTQVFGAPVGTYVRKPDVEEGEFRDAEDEVEAEVIEQDQPPADQPQSTAQGVSGSGIPGHPDPKTPEQVRADVSAGMIPGLTVGLPGEKLAKAVCGARDVVGPNPCDRQPNHCPLPHRSADGLWPCEQQEVRRAD